MSKPLGIGSCERQWADVSECSKPRRSHMLSTRLEKQSVLYGRHSINLANDQRKIVGEEHDWCSNGFDGKQLIKELDGYLGNSNVKCVPKQDMNNIVPKKYVDVLDPNYKHVREFHACLEDWKKDLSEQNNPIAHHRLLAKYANMKYAWPEDGALDNEGKPRFKKYASYVSSEHLVWRNRGTGYTDDDDRGWEWCCVLIPKGVEYVQNHFEEYELEAINSKDSEFHQIIAMTSQEENVVVYLKNDEGSIYSVNPQKLFDSLFEEMDHKFITWENYPNSKKGNPRN